VKSLKKSEVVDGNDYVFVNSGIVEGAEKDFLAQFEWDFHQGDLLSGSFWSLRSD
jgi:hypothetical protein